MNIFQLEVFDINDELIATLSISKIAVNTQATSKVNNVKSGKQLLKFKFTGTGHFDFIAFALK